MKKIYTALVGVEETAALEKTLNSFRIGLNDWDRTKVFEICGCKVVNYTILCDEETFVSITNAINGTRVY